MTINLVEMFADGEEQYPSPCVWGNIVRGHACYCHHEDGPRKCHIWRAHGDDLCADNQKGCERCGGCKLFEPSPLYEPNE